MGLDIGTTAIKGIIMSTEGKVLKTVTGGYNYYIDETAKLLNPAEFLDTCFTVIKKLANEINEDDKVLSVCSCCASGNLILIDDKNRPITPIIGWQTTISEEDKNAFYTKEELDAFYETVGWPISTMFPANYLAAIKLHRPDLIDNAGKIAMSAEYLNFALTGKWGISQSMGTPFYLMDQEKGTYNKPLLNKLGIIEEKLPPIFDKGTVLGNVTSEIAEKLGLSVDTKIVLGSFDHPSGAMGSGVFEEGEMLLSCGTSWVEFFPVSSREFAISTKGLVDRFMLNGSPYCVMKSITSVSEKIDALRLHYLGEISHKEYDDLAVASTLGCNGLRFAFTDEDYTIGDEFSKSDIARAIIEGAALILKANLEELEKCGLKAEKVTMIGGISNSKICVDIVSEILERPIKVANGQAAGAIGAALLGGIGVGIYENEKKAYEVISE